MAGADQEIPLTPVATFVIRSTDPRGNLDPIDVAEAVHVGDEIELPSIGGELGIDVFHLGPEQIEGSGSRPVSRSKRASWNLA